MKFSQILFSAEILKPVLKNSIIVLVLITAYEIFKQILFPDIGIWGSHIITIIIVSLMTFVIAFFFAVRHRRIRTALNGRTTEVQQANAELLKTVEKKQQTENALRESEAILRTLINTIPDLVWLKNGGGVYLACNKRFEDFFGAKEKKIVGKTDYDFVNRDLADFFRQKDRIAMDRDGPSINEEKISFAVDGHEETLETIKTPMYGHDGQLIGVLGIGRNITERKHNEEKREQLVKELQAALDKVKTLSGFLPICAYCKKIRDDKGYWNQIENYIQDHSMAEFSHSLCPECMEKHYGDLCDEDE